VAGCITHMSLMCGACARPAPSGTACSKTSRSEAQAWPLSSSAAAPAGCAAAAAAAAARDTGENAAGDRWPSGMRMAGLRARARSAPAQGRPARAAGAQVES